MAIANVTKYSKNFHGTMPFTTAGFQSLLAANTALSWTVPGEPNQIYRAVFRASSTAEIWVGYNVTATVPTSNTATALRNIEFIPLNEPKYLKGGDVLSFISTGTPQFGVSLLQVQDIT